MKFNYKMAEFLMLLKIICLKWTLIVLETSGYAF